VDDSIHACKATHMTGELWGNLRELCLQLHHSPQLHATVAPHRHPPSSSVCFTLQCPLWALQQRSTCCATPAKSLGGTGGTYGVTQ
jgi:hypothetical protein